MSTLTYLAEGKWEYSPEPNYYSEVIVHWYFSGLMNWPGYTVDVLRSDRYQLDHQWEIDEAKHG